MSARRREVSADPTAPRCKHNIAWGQCACCRGRFGMLVIEIDRMFGGEKPPPELLGDMVATALQNMRIRKEGTTHGEARTS